MVDKRGKYTVQHACGHRRIVTVFDKDKLADNQWLAKLQNTDCPVCWLKKQPPTFSRRTTQSGRFALDVHRGYPIREELKARDYYFKRPLWMKWFTTKAEREREIAWVRDCGFVIAGEGE